MIRLLSLLFFLIAPALHAESGLKILLVVGSGGTKDYTKEFAEISALWIDAAKKGETAIEIIGLEAPSGETPADAERLKQQLAAEKSPELWLVLIGHGTFDQRETKFNFRVLM
jgi:basic membrane lipoprotein Med (substrate-binding protein (PBP1-ABC) superfamily)